MGIIVAFLPFITFALVDRAAGPTAGLLAGSLMALAMLLRDATTADRSPKVLDIGALLLFGGLAAYSAILQPDWSLIGVRMLVDAGLLVIVLLSLAIRRPFSLQYARAEVAPELWDTPGFMHINMVISRAWAVALAVMVAAEFTMLRSPALVSSGGVVVIGALVAAIWFSGWYPKQGKQA